MNNVRRSSRWSTELLSRGQSVVTTLTVLLGARFRRSVVINGATSPLTVRPTVVFGRREPLSVLRVGLATLLASSSVAKRWNGEVVVRAASVRNESGEVGGANMVLPLPGLGTLTPPRI